MIAVERAADGTTPAQIEVRLDGRSAGRFEVPVRSSATVEPDPLVVYLHAERGRELAIDLLPTASDERSWIDWRGWAWLPVRHGFIAGSKTSRVFSPPSRKATARRSWCTTIDSPALTAFDSRRASGQTPVTPACGCRCATSRGQANIATCGSPGGNGAVGVFAFSWRMTADLAPTHGQPTRRRSSKCLRAAAAFATTPAPARPAWRGTASLRAAAGRSWQVVTRDLYADFGGFDLTGISLVVPDGEEALFDHIYLARSLDDFQWIDRELAAERAATRLLRMRRFLPSETNDPALARRIVDAFSPGFASGELGASALALDRRAPGAKRGAADRATGRRAAVPPDGRRRRFLGPQDTAVRIARARGGARWPAGGQGQWSGTCQCRGRCLDGQGWMERSGR